MRTERISAAEFIEVTDMRIRDILTRRSRRPAQPLVTDWTTGWTTRDWADLPIHHPAPRRRRRSLSASRFHSYSQSRAVQRWPWHPRSTCRWSWCERVASGPSVVVNREHARVMREAQQPPLRR